MRTVARNKIDRFPLLFFNSDLINHPVTRELNSYKCTYVPTGKDSAEMSKYEPARFSEIYFDNDINSKEQ